MHDEFAWPQAWIDDWVNDTQKLLRLFSDLTATTRTALSLPHSCVVWKTNNISPRHSNTTEPFHHPSAFNGAHHWLNRMGAAMARTRGFGVVDMSSTTAALHATVLEK